MNDSHTPEIDIAVTGSSWIGKGTGSIWSMVKESFLRANREIMIAAYSLSESDEFYELLDGCLASGIRILLIINRFETQPKSTKNFLMKMLARYNNLIIKDFFPADRREDLHAKLIVIDHHIALVGSANLTWKGMVMNHEILIRLHGRKAAQIGHLIDGLSYSSKTKKIKRRKE